jgi:hypothetical protein
MLGLQLPVNLSLLELRKEVIQLNGQILPRLLDGLNLSTPNIRIQDMQELQSLIMLSVRNPPAVHTQESKDEGVAAVEGDSWLDED